MSFYYGRRVNKFNCYFMDVVCITHEYNITQNYHKIMMLCAKNQEETKIKHLTDKIFCNYLIYFILS